MSWFYYIATYLTSGAIAVALIPFLVRFATARNLLDHPDIRKVHTHPVPRLGGIAICAAVFLSIVPALFFARLDPAGTHAFDLRVITLTASALAVFAVGLLDDLRGVPAKLKLLTLLAASLALCAAGIRINYVSFGDLFALPLQMFSWPVTVLWIVGVTVGMNFIDGLDGLAAGIAAVACATLVVVAVHSHQIGLTLLALSLLGSLSAFLIFNYNPAKIFMGDSGSMLVGFLLASIAVIATSKARTVGIALPALALGVPILDTCSTFIRRGVLQRRSLFSAERGHVHHRLLDHGLNHRRAVFVLHGVSILCAGIGIALSFTHRVGLIALTCAGLAVMMFWLFRTVGSLQPRTVLVALSRNRGISSARRKHQLLFEDSQLRFRHVTDFHGWWDEICLAAEPMGFIRVTFFTTNRDGTPHLKSWTREDLQPNPQNRLSVTLPVADRRLAERLKVNVEIDTRGCLEDAGHRVTLFARLLQDHSLADLPEGDRQLARRPDRNAHDPLLKLADDERQRSRRNAMARKARTLGPGVRVAVVHDFLYTYAGAERVLEQILSVFPEADLFSLFDFLPDGQRQFIQNKPVTTSFIQRLPRAKTQHRNYLALMPLAIEQLDVSAYDIVLSSSYVAAKGVITRPDQLHISYCHSPVRFAWDLQHQYLAEAGINRGIKSVLARCVLHYIRNWDARSANSVDVFVTNSQFVARRVEKFYRRRSTPIYPPVDTDAFTLEDTKEDFYLTASRMVPYKRIELVVDAFNRLPDRRLIVVGDGPDYARLKARAGPNVKFTGRVDGERLRNYMQRARAFVFAAEEDFGIVPVEAQACGTPVIAFGRGGVTETVIDGQTGLFFPEQSVDSLLAAIRRFEAHTWDAQVIRANSERFSVDRFRDEFQALVETEWAAFRAARPERLAPELRSPDLESLDESLDQSPNLESSDRDLTDLESSDPAASDEDAPDATTLVRDRAAGGGLTRKNQAAKARALRLALRQIAQLDPPSDARPRPGADARHLARPVPGADTDRQSDSLDPLDPPNDDPDPRDDLQTRAGSAEEPALTLPRPLPEPAANDPEALAS